MTNQELRLSVGASPGQRTLSVVVGVFVTAVGAAFVLLPLIADGLLRRLTGPGDGFASYEEARDLPPGMLPPSLQDSGGEDQPALGPLAGLCGLPCAVLGVYLVLRVLRTAAWLDASRLRVRGALRSRTVDLATAVIDARGMSERETGDDMRARGHRLPVVMATDRDSGHRIMLPLRGMGLATLPPPELLALADAITSGRPDEGRDSEGRDSEGRDSEGRDSEAYAVAGDLRRLAEHRRRT
ncbi:hypothetical protein [Micromonospora profundi]|uniref:hypothetical protein n=1 Tax=Micromonospora profundi TaxID=1420889 RepID=UPI003823ED52